MTLGVLPAVPARAAGARPHAPRAHERPHHAAAARARRHADLGEELRRRARAAREGVRPRRHRARVLREYSLPRDGQGRSRERGTVTVTLAVRTLCAAGVRAPAERRAARGHLPHRGEEGARRLEGHRHGRQLGNQVSVCVCGKPEPPSALVSEPTRCVQDDLGARVLHPGLLQSHRAVDRAHGRPRGRVPHLPLRALQEALLRHSALQRHFQAVQSEWTRIRPLDDCHVTLARNV